LRAIGINAGKVQEIVAMAFGVNATTGRMFVAMDWE
jgi:hypothetical protein